MAEKQFNTYQSSILSFELREAMLGLLNPGRYCGYDTYTSGGTPAAGVIPVHVNHTGTGIQKGTHANPPALSSKTGVVLTKQGTIIHNDSTDIDINIDDGTGNGGSIRYDVIYLEHEYEDIKGSNPSVLLVKKGTPGAGIPALTSPASQVSICIVTIPDQAIIIGTLIFTPIKPDILGDYDIDGTIYGLIGTRLYTEENYIDDGDTITESLNELDMALKDVSDAIPLTASNAETQALSIATKWVSPANLAAIAASESQMGISLMAAESDVLNGATANKFVNPSRLSTILSGIALGGDPTAGGGTLTITSIVENNIRKIGPYSNTYGSKRIQFSGTVSGSNQAYPAGTVFCVIPSTSWNPAPLQDIYDFLYIYSGGSWYAVMIKYTTTRNIILLEASPGISSSHDFRINFVC